MLATETKIVRTQNAAAAGTTSLKAAAGVDMQDYDGVLFVYALGTLTATQVTSLKAGAGAAADGSDAVDITGATTGNMADGDSNKLLVLDVFRPQKRYVTPTLVRGTANAVVDGGWAILYRGKTKPAAIDSTVSKLVALASP